MAVLQNALQEKWAEISPRDQDKINEHEERNKELEKLLQLVAQE